MLTFALLPYLRVKAEIPAGGKRRLFFLYKPFIKAVEKKVGCAAAYFNRIARAYAAGFSACGFS